MKINYELALKENFKQAMLDIRSDVKLSKDVALDIAKANFEADELQSKVAGSLQEYKQISLQALTELLENKFYTTNEAANILSLSSAAVVRNYIQDDYIKAQKFGRDWFISKSEIVKRLLK
jgi:hypothetical protein